VRVIIAVRFPMLQTNQSLSGNVRHIVRAMRPHQWLKNVLIFVPAATSHRILEWSVLRPVLLAFFSFSLCASAGYLINDLFDLKADRKHPQKCRRPFASGALPPAFGLAAAALLLPASLGLAWFVSSRYVLFVCGYLLLSAAYSMALKTVPLVDVFLLAFFYTLRIFLGGEAAGVTVSFWLAAFSIFFFYSLATVKRFTEIRAAIRSAGEAAARRGYQAEDLSMLSLWGTASGCASVVVLALYINSPEVTRLYHHPALLWPVCLAFLFWLNRVWMLSNRDALPYDPILFAVKDWPSYMVAAFVLLSILLAM
jgi:4-hydroxybenzoate polyprenyltransferase